MTSDLIPTKKKNSFRLSDQTYDFFNRLVKYVLPALGTFYFAISEIWKLPYGTEVVGTIVALTTLLGVVLAVSKKNYDNEPYNFDGDVVVSTGYDSEKTLTLESNVPIEQLQAKGVVVMQVRDADQP